MKLAFLATVVTYVFSKDAINSLVVASPYLEFPVWPPAPGTNTQVIRSYLHNYTLALLAHKRIDFAFWTFDVVLISIVFIQNMIGTFIVDTIPPGISIVGR